MKKILIFLICTLNVLLFAELSHVDSLKQSLSTADPREKPDIMIEIAHILCRTQPDSAMYYALEANRLARDHNDIIQQIDAIIECGRINFFRKHYQASLNFLHHAWDDIQKRKLDYKVGVLLNYITINHMSLGELTEAKKYAMICVDILTKDNDPDEQLKLAYQYNNLGIIETKLGNYEDALKYYLKAHRIKERNWEETKLVSSSMNIANLLVRTKNYDEALKYLNGILKINKKHNQETKARIYNSIGNVYLNKEKLQKATEYYSLALQKAQANQNLKTQSIAINNLAVVYERQEDYQAALKYYYESLSLKRQLNDNYGIMNLHKNIGSLYTLLKEFDKAEEYLLKSLKYAEEQDAGLMLNEIYKFLSQLYRETGDYEKALAYHHKYFENNDRLLNEKISEKVIEAESKFQVEKTREENLLLKRDNEIMKLKVEKEKLHRIKLLLVIIIIFMIAFLFVMLYYARRRKSKILEKAAQLLDEQVKLRTTQLQDINDELHKEIEMRKNIEKKLKTSLHDKEVMLKEIHHRVKNNMQVISSILDLQAEEIKDDGLAILFRNTQNRIQSMSMIHERLYLSEDFTQVDFDEYINSLIMHLYSGYHIDYERIQPIIEIENVPIDLDYAVPCGMIINELVTNTLKYAFPDNVTGRLWISLKQIEQGYYKLMISNNGKDFPEHIDVKNPNTVGLYLVTLLVDQIKGKLEVGKENGITYSIIFKYERKKNRGKYGKEKRNNE